MCAQLCLWNSCWTCIIFSVRYNHLPRVHAGLSCIPPCLTALHELASRCHTSPKIAVFSDTNRNVSYLFQFIRVLKDNVDVHSFSYKQYTVQTMQDLLLMQHVWSPMKINTQNKIFPQDTQFLDKKLIKCAYGTFI
jgi:hypothetical protein